jgi:hypothetical protein
MTQAQTNAIEMARSIGPNTFVAEMVKRSNVYLLAGHAYRANHYLSLASLVSERVRPTLLQRIRGK